MTRRVLWPSGAAVTAAFENATEADRLGLLALLVRIRRPDSTAATL
jgi:hypothetical protein